MEFFGGGRGFTYTNGDGATFPTLFCGERMWVSEGCTPISTTNGQDTEFCDDDGGADGCCYFFRSLDAETDVTFRVSDYDDGLESCTLAGTGLFLDGLDLLVCEVGDQPSIPRSIFSLLPPVFTENKIFVRIVLASENAPS